MPGKSPKKQEGSNTPLIRWVRTKSDENFPNGDPIFLYTLEAFNGEVWEAVPTFEKSRNKYVEVNVDPPSIVRSY